MTCNKDVILLPKIKRKRHKVDTGKDEDVELETGHLRVYFHNRYSLISLINDFLLGIVYTLGSIVSIFGWPSIYSTYLFLAGGLFLILRPVLKILRNISIYKDKDCIEQDFVDAEEEKENEEQEYQAEYDDRSDDDEGEDKNEEEKQS